MEEKISELFFSLNLNQKPSEIVEESDFEFEYSWASTIVGIKDYSYSTEFNNHPTIKGEIKEGVFQIGYKSNEEKYGLFILTLIIRFMNKHKLIDEYEKLTYEFEKYSAKTIISTIQNEDSETKSEVTAYKKHKEFEIPKLDFYFDQSEKNNYPLIVTFTTSWKQNELMKLIELQKRAE